jgi:hypothetical protein
VGTLELGDCLVHVTLLPVSSSVQTLLAALELGPVSACCPLRFSPLNRPHSTIWNPVPCAHCPELSFTPPMLLLSLLTLPLHQSTPRNISSTTSKLQPRNAGHSICRNNRFRKQPIATPTPVHRSAPGTVALPDSSSMAMQPRGRRAVNTPSCTHWPRELTCLFAPFSRSQERLSRICGAS